ncbi:calcineurin-like phosphoesterase family protein [Tamilnaduibacter salinus]|uniref:Calcineurin-like phosphoesterase family protein n=1 Tax=Tamilnaduibacter salinus TaxID=1484056 RepID=A0A2A2I5T7_9GAMM|nr:metallophosphoesterase [Tamilnaduibacter salinus]PAV26505.1 serine/threonine protein phosphatase [Tamilnaduibacter salinus]PVY79163.1 calcineurin-like phosphoesterase family protein [Tamilnaduibacter salinus]
MTRGYDVIGDIHGCANTLRALLEQMGYKRINGVYQHPRRQAVFIGDIIDRGPRIREALHLVYDMVQHGAAQIVMGNHEYNALGYCTRARPGSGKTFLREHNERHNRLIRETLEQFDAHPQEWNEFLDWFYDIPLFLEIEHFRVVHACWDSHLIETFKRTRGGNTIDEDFLHDSAALDSFAGQVMDRLLRGTDLRLPDGLAIEGRDGFRRQFFRTKFWAENPQTYNDVVFQPDPLPEHIANRRLSAEERDRILTYPSTEPPVFVGHYWRDGEPRPLAPNVACIDYSAVKYGRLVAYRMDDERTLRRDKFVWVDVERPEQPMASVSDDSLRR